MENDWIDVPDCPYCAGDVVPYATRVSAPCLQITFCGGSFPVVTPSSFVACTKCGLIIQSPHMSASRIDEYYSSGLYRETLGISVERMDADEQGRVGKVTEWLNLHPESHVDIGASRGYLLQSIGAPVQRGYDKNPKYAEAGVTGDPSALEKYELVTAVHVLEHTLDPLGELEWYKSLTSDYIYVEVPGKNCKGGPLRFPHLYYFPPEWLVGVLERIGLKILRSETEPNTRVLCRI